jgi:hypothetical protein
VKEEERGVEGDTPSLKCKAFKSGPDLLIDTSTCISTRLHDQPLAHASSFGYSLSQARQIDW